MMPAKPNAEEAEQRLCRRLFRTLLGTINGYGLIEQGDRILVALSGDTSSLALLDLLWQTRRRAPVAFDLVAVHLSSGPATVLDDWLLRLGVPHDFVAVEAGLPSPERHALLAAAALRLGCRKIALAHCREDTLLTLLRNVLYGGTLQALPAREDAQDERPEVIRPLIECGAEDLAAYGALRGLPLLSPVSSPEDPQRAAVEALLCGLSTQIPDVRAVMLNALKNVHPSHLLDQGLVAAGPVPPEARRAPAWRRALRVLPR